MAEGVGKFEGMVAGFEAVVEVAPIDRESVLGALAAANSVGEREVRDDSLDLGATRFAESMTRLNKNVLELDGSKKIKPPLTHKQKSTITNRIEALGSILYGNEGGGPSQLDDMDTESSK